MTLHVWEPEKATRFDAEETIESAMGEVLGADTRLRFTALGTLLSPPDVADKALVEADHALADARQAYDAMDLDKAKGLLETALKAYQKFLPELATRSESIAPMRDGFLLLANVRFFEGNADGARDALRYVFALDGTVRWKPGLFPPQMKKLVVEARLLYETLGTGRLDHRLRSARRAHLAQRGQAARSHAVAADRRAQRAQLHQLRAPWLGADDAGVRGRRRRRGVARAGHAVAAAAQPARAHRSRARRRRRDAKAAVAEGGVRRPRGRHVGAGARPRAPAVRDDGEPQILTAYLYDARAGRIINRLEMKVEGDLPATARVLARDLVHGVRLDGVWEPPRAAPKPKWHQRLWSDAKDDWGRFHRWKGFWYVVGGVGVAVVVGTVVGATVSHQRQVAADTLLLGGN